MTSTPRAPRAPRPPAPQPRIATDPRFSRRRQAISKAKRRRLVAVAATVLVVAVLVAVVFFTPLVAVDRVRVVGGSHTTGRDIAEVAGLSSDDNLLLVSTSSIAERSETLPWVREARVDRKLPGTVRVKVTERRPAMVIALTEGRFTVDARGRVLERGRAERGLPSLSGVLLAGLAPGDVIDDREILGALRAWRSLPRGLKRRVDGVFAPTLERISLALEGGTIVRYGAPEHLDDKSEVLAALLRRLGGHGAVPSYVDVRVPTSPALGPPLAPTPSI